nr:(5-formylfuran-3-yl)methyl phosphate synthase [Derxia gummosa]
MLVSVRDLAEARVAAAAGVDFVDCKEPAHGALGGLAPATIAAIVAELRGLAAPAAVRPSPAGSGAVGRVGAGSAPGDSAAAAPRALVSATIGDWPADALDSALARAREVAAAGVDYVKVGLWPGAARTRWLDAFAREPYAVVPVFIADAGLDLSLAARAAALRFPAVMADTDAKRGGSLIDRVGTEALAAFVAAVHGAGPVLVGLAGALRAAELPRLASLGADFAGFRSAVCAGDRAGKLDPGRLATLVAAMRVVGSAGTVALAG